MNKTKDLIKNNKLSAFLALGGISIMASMYVGLLDNFLPITRIALAIGAIGVAKMFYETNKEVTKIKLKFMTSAFLTVGSTAALLIFEHYKLPFQSVGQLVFDSVAAYGVISALDLVFNKKGIPEKPKEVILTSSEIVKDQVKKLRSTDEADKIKFDFT